MTAISRSGCRSVTDWRSTTSASTGCTAPSPIPAPADRVSYWPRGKVLGGSSSINAMVYIRGHQGDFDDWEAMGNPGWGWNDVLPYFKKSETSDQGETEWRGGHGPLHVSTMERDLHPACGTSSAGGQCGFQRSADFNAASNEGVGRYQNTARGGFRMSTARAYLRPARRNGQNLTVISRAQATRILFEGNKAIGVEFRRNGMSETVHAGREVILSAGAVNSPQLLDAVRVVGKEGAQGQHGIEGRARSAQCRTPLAGSSLRRSHLPRQHPHAQ
jgi:choline dehydrogenase